MPQNPIHAQPPLEFVPPNLQMGVVRTVGALIPTALKLSTSIVEVTADHAERLAELYRDFEDRKVRFLIAFRHPSTQDPLTIWYLLSRLVPQAARDKGISLRTTPHTYFLYDRGVPIWAGPAVAWLLPRAGGISVQRGKLDRASLKATRDKYANGEQPMAVAPEGATNGLNEVVSPLEPGVAQLSFWCLDDLREKNRTERVVIVPLGLQYRYIDPPWAGIDRVLGTLEQECGLTTDAGADRYARLTRIGESLLGVLEEYYHRFYQQDPPEPAADLSGRLHNLLEMALRTSEQYFNIQAKGSITDRCRRIEQAGWDRIYREDLKGQSLTGIQRGLADRAAEEADRRMWHMRIVEGFVAVSGSYVRDNPSADRYAETVNLLYKTVERLKGSPLFLPPALGKQRAHMTVSEPILVDELYPAYAASRQGARQAVTDLTAHLQAAMDAMTRVGSASAAQAEPAVAQ